MSEVDSNALLEELTKTQERSGQKWAAALHIKLWEMFGAKTDQDYLVSFMCNAMMAMHDSIHNNEIKTLEEKYNKLLGVMDNLVNFDHYSDGEAQDSFINIIQEWYESNSQDLYKYRISKK